MTKSKNPIIRIHDIELNTVIDREMTIAEFEQYKTNQAIEATRKAEAEAKAAQRQAILDQLGLTSEEASLLLS